LPFSAAYLLNAAPAGLATGSEGTLKEGGVATAAASGAILPTSGTTDPDILASITSAQESASVMEPAIIMSASPATAADPSSPADQPEVVHGVSAPPRSFTRRQFARAVAALKRIKTAPAAASEITTMNTGVLNAHNSYRATHRAPAMTWDNTVAAAATNWASRCLFQHEDNPAYGENLYMTSAKDAAGALAAATKAW